MNDDPPDAIDMIARCMIRQNPTIDLPPIITGTDKIANSKEFIAEEIFIPEGVR